MATTDSIILFPNDDGGISIVYPSFQDHLTIEVEPAVLDEETGQITVPAVTRSETDDEVLERVRKQAVPVGKAYLIATRDDVPEDKSTRPAWTADFTGAPINEG